MCWDSFDPVTACSLLFYTMHVYFLTIHSICAHSCKWVRPPVCLYVGVCVCVYLSVPLCICLCLCLCVSHTVSISRSVPGSLYLYCPACRTTLIATRFRVAVICPIIQVPHCITVFFYFVWFVFINHIFQFYNELCTYCNILDIYLSQNLNFVNYVLFYMKLLNYLFFSMFGSVLESCELTGVCLLLPWLIKWK